MWKAMLGKEKVQTTEEGDQEHSFYRDQSQSARNSIEGAEVLKPETIPRILVVDDDPSFGKIMRRAAAYKGADVVVCKSLEDFGSLSNFDFDVVLMDYDLGAVTGVELTKYLERLTKDEIPVVLVSQSNQKNAHQWPDSIREFVHKGLGPFAILDALFEAHEVSRINKGIPQPKLH